MSQCPKWNEVLTVLIRSVKAKRRKTTGTGRMRHLDIVRRFVKKKILIK